MHEMRCECGTEADLEDQSAILECYFGEAHRGDVVKSAERADLPWCEREPS